MRSYSITKIQFIKSLRDKNITFFSSSDIYKLFPVKSGNTLKHLLRRLKKEEIIEKLIRDKYLFLQAKKEVEDFEIANFLLTPSYISLESALSYYGLIDQFPYHIASISLSKARIYKVRNKIFKYSKIARQYFKDFIKTDCFLIASKEKALFDYIYFIYKGLRPLGMMTELQIHLKNKNTKKYIIDNADKNFISFIKKYVEF